MLAPRRKLWSTPEPAIDIALDYANLTVNDIVYDVGCGDGRVLIRMASMSITVDDDCGVIFYDEDGDCPTTSHTVKRQQHQCKQFIGIEISEERVIEARQNIQIAKLDGTIPSHVSIEIICFNALNVDYTNATVIFLYLVPRGLRLIKPLVWSTAEKSLITTVANRSDDDDNNNEEEDTSTSTTTAPSTFQIINSNTKNQQPRRIITYMSPFIDTPYVRKEYCEHQMGSAWPIFLYHCSMP
jgi:SAM-dependent methyltransferase